MGFLKKLGEGMVGKPSVGKTVLVVGLDNSGKSTLVNNLKPISQQGRTLEATPTVGLEVERFTKSHINFTMMDMSGSSKYRALWEQYLSDVQAIIFVIDSTDRIRMCVAKQELDGLLGQKEVS
ncbi:unnamed protein product, partial [Choristocarpus tenellus]